MGGSQSSPRKITLENPDDTIIKITDTVAERLRSTSEPISSRPSTEKPESRTTDDVSSSYVTTPITSLQIRREVSKELNKNNAHWEKRLKTLQEGYKEVHAELENGYNQAVEEVNKTLGKKFVNSDLPDVCTESQSEVLLCYNLNRDKPLLCSKEVQKFNNCVSNRMDTMLKT